MAAEPTREGMLAALASGYPHPAALRPPPPLLEERLKKIGRELGPPGQAGLPVYALRLLPDGGLGGPPQPCDVAQARPLQHQPSDVRLGGRQTPRIELPPHCPRQVLERRIVCRAPFGAPGDRLRQMSRRITAWSAWTSRSVTIAQATAAIAPILTARSRSSRAKSAGSKPRPRWTMSSTAIPSPDRSRRDRAG